MKTINTLLKRCLYCVAAVWAVMLQGCNDDASTGGAFGTIPDAFSGDIQPSYTIPAKYDEANPIVIRLDAPLEASVESGTEWLKLDLNLSEALYITLLPEENTGDEARTGKIIFKSPMVKDPMEVEIIQEKPVRDELEVAGLDEGLNPEGEDREIRIYSRNAPWKIEILGQDNNKPCTWIQVIDNKTSGDATGDSPAKIKLHVIKNTEGSIRLANLKITGSKVIDYPLVQEASLNTTQQVGDKGVTFNKNLIDPRYKDAINNWITAGKEGGIPTIEEEKIARPKIVEFAPGATLAQMNKVANENSSKPIIIFLKNGVYNFDNYLRLYSNALLLGESQDGVIIKMKGNGHISFLNATNAGLKNVTLKGDWFNYEPKDTEFKNVSGKDIGHRMVDMQGAKHCYVDNVTIKNSLSHSIYLTTSNAGQSKCYHNTIRNVTIDGAYCKGEGCAGYFMIQGDHHLITGCKVTNIRHISMQEQIAKYNVLFRNNFEQEVTFHDDDGGWNLVQENNITIPANMSAYYAIMGPWSTQHKIGKKNFIYRNKCLEKNHSNKRPWSDENLYMGPLKLITGSTTERYNVFKRLDDYPNPTGQTLYPIILK